MDGLTGGMKASVSAMKAERLRLQTAAKNLAFSRTTRTPDGGPYRRQEMIFESVLDAQGNAIGVEASVEDDDSPFPVTHDPSHPDADADGNVKWPNVEMQHEVVDMTVARRGYEANAAAFEALISSLSRAIDLGRS
jgi:flagellar basal-body rod protein FlgC